MVVALIYMLSVWFKPRVVMIQKVVAVAVAPFVGNHRGMVGLSYKSEGMGVDLEKGSAS